MGRRDVQNRYWVLTLNRKIIFAENELSFRYGSSRLVLDIVEYWVKYWQYYIANIQCQSQYSIHFPFHFNTQYLFQRHLLVSDALVFYLMCHTDFLTFCFHFGHCRDLKKLKKSFSKSHGDSTPIRTSEQSRMMNGVRSTIIECMTKYDELSCLTALFDNG